MTEVATFDASTTDLGDKIANLTLLQAKALADYLKQQHGIEPAAGGAVMMAAAPGAAPAAAEEKTEFDVVLAAIGDNKIGVIKVVRSDEPGTEGSEGPGRIRPQGGQDGGFEGRRRQAEGRAGSRRRQSRNQVKTDNRRPAPFFSCLSREHLTNADNSCSLLGDHAAARRGFRVRAAAMPLSPNRRTPCVRPAAVSQS